MGVAVRLAPASQFEERFYLDLAKFALTQNTQKIWMLVISPSITGIHMVCAKSNTFVLVLFFGLLRVSGYPKKQYARSRSIWRIVLGDLSASCSA